MQVARISMGEYKSSNALDQYIRDYSKNFGRFSQMLQAHQQFEPGLVP